MITLLFVWALLSQPTDKMICSMWIDHPLTPQDMAAAGCNWSKDQAGELIVRYIDIRTGAEICARLASDLPRVSCKLPLSIDHYYINVYWPDHQDQLCLLTIDHTGQPSQADIRQKCPQKALQQVYTPELVSTGPYVQPEPPKPSCGMPDLTADELPFDPQGLATYQSLDLLAYHLRWSFGDDRQQYAWQNQWDRLIWQAGVDNKVPPSILKQLFSKESQFWPLWSQSIDDQYGEVGLGRLTDDGADLVMHYAPDLYNRFCPQAIFSQDCSIGYDVLNPNQRLLVRNSFRKSLMDTGWPDQAVIAQTNKIPVWGRILAAYYCAAGEAVSGWGDRPAAERWQMTLAAYHSGPECIRDGTICQDGKKYLGIP